MGKPLGIPLGIDFQKLDSDLNKVADRIESLGKSAALRLGAGGGGGDSAAANTDQMTAAMAQLGPQLGQLGLQLSQGIAVGIRFASAKMVEFAGKIAPMMDRLTGSVITMFQRIDASMKFPAFQTFFKTAELKVSNFAAFWRKPMTDIDVAMSGGFGGTIAKIAKIFKSLFDSLGKMFIDSMTSAMNMVVAEMKTMSAGMGRTEASASLLAKDLTLASAEAAKFAKFQTIGKEGLKTSIGGPKIGAGTNLLTPPPPVAPKSLGEKVKQFLPSTPQQMGGFKLAPVDGGGIREFVQGLKIGTRAALGLSVAVGGISLLGMVGGVGVVTKGIVLAAKAGSALSAVMGGVGVPAGAIATTLSLGSALGVIGLKVGAGAMRSYHFLSSLGDVAKKTYSDMYSGEKTAAAGLAPLQSGLAKTDAQVKTIGGSASTMGAKFRAAGAQLLAAFGVIGVLYKVVEFFKKSVTGASDLNETVAVGKGIFGDAFGSISAQADTLSKKYGIMREEQIGIANQFGAMAQGAGYTEQASARLANTMTDLSLNFAQTWQIPFSEAAEKVRAGLGGMGRGLKQYGVYIDDTTVKSMALSDGLATVASSSSKGSHAVSSSMKGMPKGFSSVETAGKSSKGGGGRSAGKVVLDRDVGMMERADIIMKGLAYTQGALERTSSGAAAQFRKAGGGVGEFGVRIGELLMPAIQAAIGGFNNLLAGIIDVVDYAAPAIKGFVSIVVSGWNIMGFIAGKIGTAIKTSIGNVISGMIPSITSWGSTFAGWIKTLELVAGNMPIVWEIIKLKFGEFVENSIRRIASLSANFGRINEWIRKNWYNLLADIGSIAGIGLGHLLDNMESFQKAIAAILASDWLKRNWLNMFLDMLYMMNSVFDNMLKNATNFGKALISAIKGDGFKFEWTPLLDGFRSTTEKFPDELKDNFKWIPLLDGFKATTDKLPEMIKPNLISTDEEIKKLWGSMKMPGEPPSAAGPKRPGEAAEKGKGEFKMASLVEANSKEASSILARNQMMGRGGTVGDKTVGLLGQSVQIQRDLLAEQRKKKPEFKVAT